MRREVDFFYGLGSRYSYLASTRIARLEEETGCRVRWRPLSSRDLMARRGQDPFRGAAPSGQYEWPYRQYDAECWAAYYGVPYKEPEDFRIDPRFLARACVAAGRLGGLVDYSRRLFAAIFMDGRVIDEAACADTAEALGLARFDFERAGADPEVEAELDATTAEAHRRGAFGVPTFFVGERMFWGNDRLPLVRHFLETG